MKEFGFIIIRNVNNENQNRFWIESYNSIRKVYDDIPIIIIDNNSNKNYLTSIEHYNCNIIESEYHESRQLGGFYYHNLLKKFDKAVIIHDSVFINNFVDVSKVDDVKFIWNFITHDYDDKSNEMYLINNLINNKNLIDIYNSKKWRGCLGNMAVISLDFLELLDKKYNFLNLKNCIKNNAHQCALERVFAVLCYSEKESIYLDDALIEEITLMKWGYSFDEYIRDKNNVNLTPFTKTFNARQ